MQNNLKDLVANTSISVDALRAIAIERCQASLDEVIANPVVRHEITLPESRKFWSLPGTPDELNYGILEETWRNDNSILFTNMLKHNERS